MENPLTQPMNKWWFAASILLALYAIASITSFLLKDTTLVSGDKIVIIPITGTITLDHADGSFFELETANADDLVKKIQDARDDSSVKAVLFEINSPGGSAVASKEIADAIKTLNKTNYAVIREMGASGAYWIAAATDTIIAQDASLTGSIGVISSYLEFSGLLDDYNVTYQRLVAGKYKDLGTPFKTLTPEERTILEKKLAIIHTSFLNAVKEHRNLTPAQLDRITTGEFFLGSEAKELGLVDVLGSKQDAITLLKHELKQDTITVVEERPSKGLLNYLTQTGAYHFGRGFATALAQTHERKETITL